MGKGVQDHACIGLYLHLEWPLTASACMRNIIMISGAQRAIGVTMSHCDNFNFNSFIILKTLHLIQVYRVDHKKYLSIHYTAPVIDITFPSLLLEC